MAARDSERALHLDRVSLDGLVVRRLSATLHVGGADRPELRDSPWWAYLACEHLAGRYDGARTVLLQASTADGRQILGQARVIDRRDDPYGTQLILSGLAPLIDDIV